MKYYNRFLALGSAALLLRPFCQLAVSAEDFTILIPRSAYLTSEDAGVKESDITGHVYVTLEGNRAVTVSITKYTAESGANGYVYHTAEETVLEPSADGESITYMIELDNSNRIDLSDPDNIGTVPRVYQSDYTQESYTSVFTISIADAKIKDDIFTEEEIVIADIKYDPQTNYHYTVSYVEDQEPSCIVEKKDPVVAENTVTLERNIQFNRPSYNLGDVNENGVIDLTDATLVLTYYAEQAVASQNLPDICVEAADVDRDGEVTLNDATLVLTYYAESAVGYKGTIEELIASLNEA